jgi:60 kDa SS-A/Ro ribonucleoprotein
MFDLNLFRRTRGRLDPSARPRLTTNSEGAPAFAFPAEHRLAQCALTGCLNGTFYADAESQLDAVLALANTVDAEFVAKVALEARERGHMKDMPALLCAVLAVRDGELLERIFDRVIDNGRMLRGFVQMVRSGRTGRRSLGSRPKRLVRRWLDRRADVELVRDAVGADPSLADVVRMVHPRPASARRRALYGWLLERPHEHEALPDEVRALVEFHAGATLEPPDVPFQMLTSRPLETAAWRAIARRGSWQMVRQNLNTFARHGVFADAETSELIAEKLADPARIASARVLPYQVMTTLNRIDAAVPAVVRDALTVALDRALAQVPVVTGEVFVSVDMSGSMSAPITGFRKGATTKTTCRDVAALIGAAFLRSCPGAEVIAFNSEVVPCVLHRRAPLAETAAKLARLPAGGTNCSAPLRLLLDCLVPPDAVIFVSDNESWIDASRGGSTAMLDCWNRLKAIAPRAKLVCIDLVPNRTSQVPERQDVLNVGGFSDAVFEVVGDFLNGRDASTWVERIAKLEV